MPVLPENKVVHDKDKNKQMEENDEGLFQFEHKEPKVERAMTHKVKNQGPLINQETWSDNMS